jgi:hypothetical protein
VRRVDKAPNSSLTDQEVLLVRDTEAAALRDLDEDQLIELHGRVRRARDKHVKVYRRGASAAVARTGARGSSYVRNQRARDKAEVFEGALARVSRQLGVVARRASDELRAERIAEARAARSAGPARTPGTAVDGAVPSPRRPSVRTTGGIKKDASSRAQGGRRQAARDAR